MKLNNMVRYLNDDNVFIFVVKGPSFFERYYFQKEMGFKLFDLFIGHII